MADWYEVVEGEEIGCVWASNTRTAFDRAFRQLCGMDYKLPPGEKMTITVFRLPGGREKAKFLEKTYQELQQQKRLKRQPAQVTEKTFQ